MSKRKAILSQTDKLFSKEYAETLNIKEAELLTIIREYKTYCKSILEQNQDRTQNREKYKSGVLAFDVQFGGLHYGITHIYGREDMFKSSLSYYLATLNNSLYINSDAKDIIWSSEYEDNISILIGEHKLSNKLKNIFSINPYDLIILDSLAATDRAYQVFKTLIKLCGANRELKVLIVNQTRANRYTGTDDRPAGSDFYLSASSDVIKIEAKNEIPFGFAVTYYNEKSKARATCYYTKTGILSNEIYVIQLAISEGLVIKRGAKLSYNNKLYSYKEITKDNEVVRHIWKQLEPLKEFDADVYLERHISLV
jgi:hypothetical protein